MAMNYVTELEAFQNSMGNWRSSRGFEQYLKTYYSI